MFKPLTPHDLLNFYRRPEEFLKGTGTLTSGAGSPEFFNRVYGALIWRQMNTRANALSILPSVQYEHAGWRVQPENPSTKSNIVPANEAELGSVVYPDIVTLQTRPYILSQTAEITDVMEALSTVRDDVALNASVLRMNLGIGFITALNQQILHPITLAPIANAWTSLDWIVAVHNERGKNAGWGNTIFGVDRSAPANSWANAYVDFVTSGTRALSKDILINLTTRVREQGGEPSCWVMHPQAYGKVLSLFEQNVLLSIIGEKKIAIDVGGIKTPEGHEVGLTVSTLFGFPIIPDAFIATDATNDPIGRIYLLSFGNEQGIGAELAKSFLIPFMTYESRDFATMNRGVVRIVYRVAGDLVCRRFNIQAKARNLT